MKKAKNKTAHAIKSIAERMANMACGSASAIMAVSAIAVGAVSMTASAYSPTITKSFGSSAKATLYADSSYAYGTTTCSGKDCTVSVTYHGTTKYGSGYGYANAKNSASGSGTRASSYHTAGGYSTNISY